MGSNIIVTKKKDKDGCLPEPLVGGIFGTIVRCIWVVKEFGMLEWQMHRLLGSFLALD
jgi:hypothetical protein